MLNYVRAKFEISYSLNGFMRVDGFKFKSAKTIHFNKLLIIVIGGKFYFKVNALSALLVQYTLNNGKVTQM